MTNFQKIALGIYLAGSTPAALANMRRPQQRDVPISRHPKTFAPALEVQREHLEVVCGQRDCSTKVLYNVANLQGQPLDLSITFLAPAQGAIESQCAEGPIESSILEKVASDSNNNYREQSEDYVFGVVPIAAGTFQCILPPGPTNIKVEYTQLVAFMEEGVSYFSSSWFMRMYEYELAPLKEWNLAGDFHLDFDLIIPDEPLGFFARIFGLDPEINCMSGDHLLKETSRQHSGKSLTISYKWGKDFPDRLKCKYSIR